MFNRVKPTSFTSLQEEKQKILGVFTLMQKELEKLHGKQADYKNELKMQIADLQIELGNLDDSLKSTNKTIDNIDNIVNNKKS